MVMCFDISLIQASKKSASPMQRIHRHRRVHTQCTENAILSVRFCDGVDVVMFYVVDVVVE